MQGFLDTDSDPYKTSFSFLMHSLVLTRWDEKDVISVPSSVVSHLNNYHLAGIRHLYSCYRNKFKGAILNHEVDMNFATQVSVFLNASINDTNKGMSILIVCSENKILWWLYHLKFHGKITKVQHIENEATEVVENLIIVSNEKIKLLQNISKQSFSFVVIDEFDVVYKKRVFKHLQGNFHIGLSTHNFLKEKNQKMFYAMINWVAPEEVRRNLKLHRHQWLHYKFWHRLTWSFSKKYRRPTEQDKKNYMEKIQIWADEEGKLNRAVQINQNLPKYSVDNKKNIINKCSNVKVENLDEDVNIKKKSKKINSSQISKGKKKISVTKKSTREKYFRNVIHEANTKILCAINYQSVSENVLKTVSDGDNDSVKLNVDRSQPMLNNFSKSSDSEEDNSIILSLLESSENSKSFNIDDNIIPADELSTILEQPLEEFVKSLDETQDEFEVLTSIISSKSTDLSSFSTDETVPSENSDSLQYVQNLKTREVNNDIREQILNLLSDSIPEDFI